MSLSHDVSCKYVKDFDYILDASFGIPKSNGRLDNNVIVS